MSNLLRANLARLLKMKAFWVGMAVLGAYALFIAWDTYSAIEHMGWEATLADFYGMTFASTLVFGLVTSIICSLFVGTEYSDGVIRNKLVTGQKRSSVYLADFLTCTTLSLILLVVQMGCGFCYAVIALGTELVDWGYLLSVIVVACLTVISFAAVYNFVSMLNSNKTHGVIINILLFFAFCFLASFLYSGLIQPEQIESPVSMVMTDGNQVETIVEMLDNPYYIEGLQRNIYQFLFDALPGGQMYQVASAEVTKPGLLLGYSAILILLMNVAGVLLFRRKDLK